MQSLPSTMPGKLGRITLRLDEGEGTMKMDMSERSVARFMGIGRTHLKNNEEVKAALPVWLGKTYTPFFVAIVVGVAVGSIAGSSAGNSIVFTIAGVVLGGLIGSFLAKRKAKQHPLDVSRLQVYIAATNRRLLVLENGSMGKPGGLKLDVDRKNVSEVTYRKGGFIRPALLGFQIDGVQHDFEFSGLWKIGTLLTELGMDKAT